MRRIYVNLLGEWIDITDTGTVEKGQDPVLYFKENLGYDGDSDVPGCFKGGYLKVEYGNREYRIDPACVQIVDQ